MRAHGEGGHIVNTASILGMLNGFGFSSYGASKSAVVAMSEGLAKRLEPHGIGVSVLCPGFVRTRISESGRNRQDRYGPPYAPAPGSPAATVAGQIAERVASWLEPAEVAERVLAAIRDNDLYVFTDPEMHDLVRERFAAILAAMDKVAAR
jgi:NAD(P)-dependent dehydrogenase (short-subunit alcohol dehydrogenase family)